MRQYFAFFKIRFLTCIQYRAAAIAGILTQIFFGFVFIMVYYAFYTSNSGDVPMSFSSLVSYLWLQQAFYSLTYIYHKEKEVIKMIKDGNIAYELCRPGSLYFKWYIRIIARKYAMASLRFIPVIILALLLPKPFNLVIPSNILNIVLFIITLILSSLLITSFATLCHVLVFYTIDADGIISMFNVIADFFSGGIVPILFLPKIIQKISNILPFQYMADVPYRIFTGDIANSQVLSVIIIQVLWTIILILLGYFLAHKVLKKAVIQGG